MIYKPSIFGSGTYLSNKCVTFYDFGHGDLQSDLWAYKLEQFNLDPEDLLQAQSARHQYKETVDLTVHVFFSVIFYFPNPY